LVHITEGKITLKDINELVSKLTWAKRDSY
jgi:hypothetical protein